MNFSVLSNKLKQILEILCLNETWFNEQTQAEIDGYNSYHDIFREQKTEVEPAYSLNLNLVLHWWENVRLYLMICEFVLSKLKYMATT